MQRKSLALTLCIFLVVVSCGGSSTGPDNQTDTEAPAAPENLNGNSGDQQIELNWNVNDENDLAGYNVYRSTSSFSTVSGMNPVNGSSLIESQDYTDTGLENGTTYFYRLTAVDESSNESKVSSQLKITPFSNPPDRP
jgi:TolB protein